MIESCYWKEELARIAKMLDRTEKPLRWTERRQCVLERDLMIAFFLLRRLFEFKKVSTEIADRKLTMFAHKSQGKRVTLRNSHRLDELYDFDREAAHTKSVLFLTNQFVHAYTGTLARDDSRNWSDVFIVSDYDRNDCIWRIPTSIIRDLLLEAANDYPHSAYYRFNESKGDYDVFATSDEGFVGLPSAITLST